MTNWYKVLPNWDSARVFISTNVIAFGKAAGHREVAPREFDAGAVGWCCKETDLFWTNLIAWTG